MSEEFICRKVHKDQTITMILQLSRRKLEFIVLEVVDVGCLVLSLYFCKVVILIFYEDISALDNLQASCQ